MLRSVLTPPLLLYRSRIRGAKWVRQFATANYTTGKLAIGEQHRYGIPACWITVDLADADFRINLANGVLPFSPESFSVVYSAHVIEHLNCDVFLRLLKEIHRVLKPGGHFRLETPDAERIIDLYRSRHPFIEQVARENYKALVNARHFVKDYGTEHIAFLGLLSCYIENGATVPVFATREEVDAKLASLGLDEFLSWCVSLQSASQQASHGHVNVVHFDKLSTLLRTAGFRDIVRLSNGKTNIPGIRLNGLERPHRAIYSLYVEACK